MEKKVIRILHAIDAAVAHHAAKEMAAQVGFGEKESEEIAIVVDELAANQFRHARGGIVRIEPLPGDPPGILVEAEDEGPGIVNIEQALADGYSTAGGLGLGLGTVNRLMDVLEITSKPGQGTQIRCQRRLSSPPLKATSLIIPSSLDIGVATRPIPGIGVNGDAFVVKHWGDRTLVGIIDGLGHGHLASLAAETARQYVESHSDQTLQAIFQGTARACLATRGVVMALAAFDFSDHPVNALLDGKNNFPQTDRLHPAMFSFSSIGNIEARLLGSPEPVTFNPRRGVIGLNAPKAAVTQHAWNQDCILILHSDGLSTRWQPGDFPSLRTAQASAAAQELLISLAKEEDDATVVVVKASGKDQNL